MTQQENNHLEQQEREALVAEWLKATPGFFDRHANLLAEIQLKNPHGDRAISLQERQLGVLRQQNQALNQRLSDMLRFGSQNDKTQGLMIAWLKSLLVAKTKAEVDSAITDGLSKVFEVESVQLIEESNDSNYCGPKEGAPDQLKNLMADEVKSLAVIDLPAVQMQMILASHQNEKFTVDMGRVYLEQIGELASAAMIRAKD
jgi:uncharacterized protein YigA (DUF484 family)